MNNAVCITRHEYNKAKHIFDASEFKFIVTGPEEDGIADAIKQNHCSAVVLGVDLYKEYLYTALPRGGLIARFGVGHDGIDKQKATASGICVTNTPGALDDSVAEHAMFLIGSLARDIHKYDHQVKTNIWQSTPGIELAGKKLLIIGCGKIGSKLAKIAHFGFGMHVIGFDVAQINLEQARLSGFTEILSSLEDWIKDADFISVHLPSISSTRHFVNSDFLSKCKPSAYLINTARGPIFDENAIFDALKSGIIKGAALDVFESEPYKPVHAQKDLRTLPNILMTNHVASNTVEACSRMAKQVLHNLHLLKQRCYSEMNIVNSDILKEISK
jgi:lactate dehydrogenase-like 2-hydroxyacid dehydrogenase